jgi:RNA polymerase sigma-70 factor (ECF subfamily)
MTDDIETSLTLLRTLQADSRNDLAWGTFLDRYRPLIEDWCRRWGLNGVDTDEAIHDLVFKLFAKHSLRTFDPSRRFRVWLKTVVRNVVCDLKRQKVRRPGDQGRGGSDDWLSQIEDPEGELADALARRIPENWEEAQRIRAAVQAKVAAKTWEAFALRALEGRPAKEVAAQLGMTVAGVHQARYSVGKLLQAEGKKGRRDPASGREGSDECAP